MFIDSGSPKTMTDPVGELGCIGMWGADKQNTDICVADCSEIHEFKRESVFDRINTGVQGWQVTASKSTRG
jgi:hypothetical protein